VICDGEPCVVVAWPLAAKRAGAGISSEETLGLGELEAGADEAKGSLEALASAVPDMLSTGLAAGEAVAAGRLDVRRVAAAGLGEGTALVCAVSAYDALRLVMAALGREAARKASVARAELARLVKLYRLAPPGSGRRSQTGRQGSLRRGDRALGMWNSKVPEPLPRAFARRRPTMPRPFDVRPFRSLSLTLGRGEVPG
jgi:hypothetical protein